MSTEINDYVSHSEAMKWTPLVESGINTRGIYVKPLRLAPDLKRPVSFLLRFDPGASYPYHTHPEGEEILVLEGSCKIEGLVLERGDYLYTPPGFSHSVISDSGCVLYLMVPAEVEIIKS